MGRFVVIEVPLVAVNPRLLLSRKCSTTVKTGEGKLDKEISEVEGRVKELTEAYLKFRKLL